jgi:signal transduction histidine kinase
VSLRRRLLLATAPLAIALALLGAFAVARITALGHTAEGILAANYRSVLAAQRMKEALERTDSAALFAATGQHERARAAVAANHETFERELRVEEGNITEPGEAELAQDLRAHWSDYVASVDGCLGSSDTETVRACYFRELEPRFVATKGIAERVLALNQDAMVAKSDGARRQAARDAAGMAAAALLAFGVGGFTSWALARRILRPLSVLGQAVEQFGRGDFAVRANVRGGGEIAELAHTFNAMAERMEEYRRSSLGELVQAQLAAQAAIDALPDPVIVVSPQGEVVSTNRAADGLLRPGDPGPLSLPQLEPALRAAIDAAVAHVLRGKGAWTTRGFEDAVVVAQGAAERSFLIHAEPLQEERGIVAATVLLQDVTRLRRIEELRDDLVSTAAHQLRTPLTALRMAIHLCLDGSPGPLTEKQHDLLYSAREECERLQETVDELLELARLQAGRIELALSAIPTAELLDQAERGARAAADARGVRLAVDPAMPGEAVRADPERVQLVFANLLENAIRYTPPGGSIALRARAEHDHVRFEVEDQGPGIAPEHQARVFEKFVRLPGVETGGAGLGLSIARDLVRAHGGEIGLESRHGGGSTFWFTLPKVEEDGAGA